MTMIENKEAVAAQANEIAELRLQLMSGLGHKCPECLTDAHVKRLMELLEVYSLPADVADWIESQKTEREMELAHEGHAALRHQIEIVARSLGWDNLVDALVDIDHELLIEDFGFSDEVVESTHVPQFEREPTIEEAVLEEPTIEEAVLVGPPLIADEDIELNEIETGEIETETEKVKVVPAEQDELELLLAEMEPIEFDLLLEDDIELFEMPHMETVEVVNESELESDAIGLEVGFVLPMPKYDVPDLPQDLTGEYQHRLEDKFVALLPDVRALKRQFAVQQRLDEEAGALAQARARQQIARVRPLAAEVQRLRLLQFEDEEAKKSFQCALVRPVPSIVMLNTKPQRTQVKTNEPVQMTRVQQQTKQDRETARDDFENPCATCASGCVGKTMTGKEQADFIQVTHGPQLAPAQAQRQAATQQRPADQSSGARATASTSSMTTPTWNSSSQEVQYKAQEVVEAMFEAGKESLASRESSGLVLDISGMSFS